jgi:hypothetical protein
MILKEYLKLQFIQIADDPSWEKLLKAPKDVVEKISNNKAKLISYTLAALNINVSIENPEIIEVKDILFQNWNTWQGAAYIKDTPVVYLRAIILDALELLAAESDDAAVIIWYSVRNILHNVELGKEKQLLDNFFESIGTHVENSAIKKWSLESFNDDKVEEDDEDDDNDTLSLLGLRTTLLWWKESLYSNSKQLSYRDIEIGSFLQLLLAYDLSLEMSEICPQSVDYFLKETYRAVIGDKSKESMTLQDFITEVLNNWQKVNFLFKNANNKSSILGFIAHCQKSEVNIENIQNYLGIAPSVSMRKNELLVWLFHDFQLQKLIL